MADARVFLQIRPQKTVDHEIKCLFDTGAQVSLITPAAFRNLKKYGYNVTRVHNAPPIEAANGERMRTLGAYHCYFYIEDVLANGVFIVAPDIKDPIIGMNIIKGANLTLDPASQQVIVINKEAIANAQTLKVQAVSVQQQSADEPKVFANIVTASTISIPPRTSVKCAFNVQNIESEEIVRQSMQAYANFFDIGLMAHFKTDQQGKFWGYLSNPSLQEITIAKRTRVAGMQDPDDFYTVARVDMKRVQDTAKQLNSLKPHTKQEKEEIRKQLQESVNASVPYAYREDYMRMLMKHEHYFSAHKHDLGSEHY